MNKKLLTLSITVVAVAALLAGNQTIRSINSETSKSMSSANDAHNITTVITDSSATHPKESKPSADNVNSIERQSPAPSEKQAVANKISATEAEHIALKKAGFSASEVYDKEVELDYENGVLVYEVSFEKIKLTMNMSSKQKTVKFYAQRLNLK